MAEPHPKATGTKHDQSKPRLNLLSRPALCGIGEVLGFGAEQYGENNWRQGFEYSRLIGAALRHILAYNDGEDLDPESGKSHIDHALCCLMFLSDQIKRGTGIDDRYKPGA
jgi:hypothetical protein